MSHIGRRIDNPDNGGNIFIDAPMWIDEERPSVNRLLRARVFENLTTNPHLLYQYGIRDMDITNPGAPMRILSAQDDWYLYDVSSPSRDECGFVTLIHESTTNLTLRPDDDPMLKLWLFNSCEPGHGTHSWSHIKRFGKCLSARFELDLIDGLSLWFEYHIRIMKRMKPVNKQQPATPFQVTFALDCGRGAHAFIKHEASAPSSFSNGRIVRLMERITHEVMENINERLPSYHCNNLRYDWLPTSICGQPRNLVEELDEEED